ncbi:MAG: hypothetical protein IJZ87_10015 [Bacteroidales bacterium]|nr:hypothetical protein [Bacteroidales bacterium]
MKIGGNGMDVILNYLVEKWPAFVIVIITACVVWRFARWYNRLEKVEEKVDDLPCENHEDLYPRFVNTEEKVNTLPCSKHDDIFQDIREQLVEIRTILTIKSPKVANTFSQKESLRELNKAGIELFSDIQGEEFLNQNKDIFIKGIDNKNPKTALDVEESALEVLFTLTDNDMFIRIKNWVCNCSTRKIIVDGVEKKYDITMSDVCFVLSLPLRNMYLDLHPELREMVDVK